ncbi:pyridoxal-phosphate dependent enzyme [Spiribacter halobius]|uniref:Threonine/serine dehydratase n=1 Tax=Sediminicurvatus halobius TaxID=2182432 RepID=A0A2U2N956_9GAMM|nr:pyridoxal-phosphate dependent enzyme [Spiribacter halobius]PWG65529.1 threonine/serine dehydratase [Spiribacter halobius]UEX76555.1 pyridoxal-phosphate dependent enzyme [Spiribacter halobius]
MQDETAIRQALPTLETVRQAAARLQPTLAPTPTLRPPDLADDLGLDLRLKAENLQRTGSFKARGALNWVLTASPAELAGGLITVSAGNHALALAWAAGARGVPVTVVMPEGSSSLKIRGARALGAEVIVRGSISEAVAYTHELRTERGLTLVHPYDDPRVMAGQGTVGLELLAAVPDAACALCPVGGGGLISGLGIALRALRPDIRVIGVEPAGAATLRNAWDRNDPSARLERVETIAASLAPVVVGRYTYAASRAVVDELVTVSEDAIREATRQLIGRARLYVETGCSVGIAALLEGRVSPDPDRPTVAIITGGNMDFEQFAELAAG